MPTVLARCSVAWSGWRHILDIREPCTSICTVEYIRQAYENLEGKADDEDEAAASMRSMVPRRAASLRSSSSPGSLGWRFERERGHSALLLRGKGKEKKRLNILGTPKPAKTRRAFGGSLF